MSDLAQYQWRQARLASALVRYQRNPDQPLCQFGLAIAYERRDDMAQAVLYHSDGGQIESGWFEPSELAVAREYVLGVGA